MQWSDIGLSEKDKFFQRWFLFLFGTVLIRTVRIGHQRCVCRSYGMVKVFAYLVIGLQIIPWTTLVMCLWMSNKGLWSLCINVMPLFNFAVSCFASHGLSLHPHLNSLLPNSDLNCLEQLNNNIYVNTCQITHLNMCSLLCINYISIMLFLNNSSNGTL